MLELIRWFEIKDILVYFFGRLLITAIHLLYNDEFQAYWLKIDRWWIFYHFSCCNHKLCGLWRNSSYRRFNFWPLRLTKMSAIPLFHLVCFLFPCSAFIIFKNHFCHCDSYGFSNTCSKFYNNSFINNLKFRNYLRT